MYWTGWNSRWPSTCILFYFHISKWRRCMFISIRKRLIKLWFKARNTLIIISIKLENDIGMWPVILILSNNSIVFYFIYVFTIYNINVSGTKLITNNSYFWYIFVVLLMKKLERDFFKESIMVILLKELINFIRPRDILAIDKS